MLSYLVLGLFVLQQQIINITGYLEKKENQNNNFLICYRNVEIGAQDMQMMEGEKKNYIPKHHSLCIL